MNYFVTPTEHIICPGKTKSFFKLALNYDYFHPQDIILNSTDIELLIISQPNRKWYKLLLQYVTFGLYKAPWQYEVKNLNNDTTTKRSTCAV